MLKFFSMKEEINLIKVKIDGLKQIMASTLYNVKSDLYSQRIATPEEKMNSLLLNTNY